MVETMKTKPLCLVLIVTAHMVFDVLSQAEVTGILGASVTLQFTFKPNVSLAQRSHFLIHRQMEAGWQKIAEFEQGKEDIFDVNPQNNSVFWQIPKLKSNDNGCYRASLIEELVEKSESVNLIVQELNTSSTVSPIPSDMPTVAPEVGASHMMILLLISPVVVLIAALPFLIWALVGRKDKPPRQNSKSMETVPESVKVPERSLVYSVLDFPKRSSAVVEVNPSDTEYAAVNYLPEMRKV